MPNDNVERKGRATGFANICNADILSVIANFLDGNDVPVGIRLVNKAASTHLSGLKHTTLRLSQPVPPHAFARHGGAPGAMRSMTLKQRHQLLCLTAASGSVANLELALSSVGFLPTDEQKQDMLQAAAAAGRLAVCDMLLERGCEADFEALEAAASAGQQEACALLLDRGAGRCHRTVYVMYVCTAARHGHADLMRWLLERPDGPLGPGSGLQRLSTIERLHLLAAAAAGFELPALQALYATCLGGPAVGQQAGAAAAATEPPPPPPPQQQQVQPDLDWLASAARAAAGSPIGDWAAKLEWIESLTPQGQLDLLRADVRCETAATCADALARLTWLAQRGYRLGRLVTEQAARAGHVEAVAFLLQHGMGMCGAIVLAAARAGKVEVLQLVHARGCSMGEEDQLALAAAEAGHVGVLGWAAEVLQVDLRNPWFMEAAARTGSVALVSWLRQRGARWSALAFEGAAGSGCEEAVEWMAAQGCPKGTGGAPYLSAGRVHDAAMIRCLHRLGCPWGPAGKIFRACLQEPCKPLPLLCLLLELGCPVDEWEKVLRVAKRKDSDCPDEVRAWLAAQKRQQPAPASRLQEWKRRKLQK